MKYYQITDIEFDFDDEDLTEDEKKLIVNYTKKYLWDSPEEENLADVITNNTGWCIKSLKYTVK